MKTKKGTLLVGIFMSSVLLGSISLVSCNTENNGATVNFETNGFGQIKANTESFVIGEYYEFTFEPNEGFILDETNVTLNDFNIMAFETVDGVSKTTVKIHEKVNTLYAGFISKGEDGEDDIVKVNKEIDGAGTVTLDKEEGVIGEKINVTLDYNASEVWVSSATLNGNDIKKVDDTHYWFTLEEDVNDLNIIFSKISTGTIIKNTPVNGSYTTSIDSGKTGTKVIVDLTYDIENYSVDTATNNGKDLTIITDKQYSFFLEEGNNNLVITFKAEDNSATITPTLTGTGSYTLSKNNGVKGDTITVNLTYDEASYKVSSIENNGKSCTKVTDKQYTFVLERGNNNLVIKITETGTNDYSYLYANTIKPTRDETYYASCKGLKGEPLKNALHNIIKGHTSYTYKSLNASMLVTDVDPDNPSNFILTYEGSYPKNTAFNKEHTWAKSHGDFGETQPRGTDMHHLRPSNSNLNSVRSNYYFGNAPVHDNSTDCGYKYSWSRDTMKGNYLGNHSEIGQMIFEPKDEFKGDVARMIFYMAVRYEGDASSEGDLEVFGPRPSNFETFGVATSSVQNDKGAYHGVFMDMYDWIMSGDDPISNFEMNRNNIIDGSYQHNRNPFIDHPEFVEMIYDKNYSGKGALM